MEQGQAHHPGMGPCKIAHLRLEPSLDRIAATGAAMELNTSGVLKILPEMNPSPRQLAMMCERGIPVVIGADAHVPERVGDGYETALRLLESVGYRSVRYYVDRLPIDLSIDAALNSLVPSDL